MSISITWSIEKMECYQEVDGLSDVVFNVYWRADATSGIFTASFDGSVTITPSGDSGFTPYNQLSQDQVIDWVKSALGDCEITSLEKMLEINIAGQPLPTTLSYALPWTLLR
jgi:hypothetical protein